MVARRIVLLGPQRHEPTLAAVAAGAGVRGRVATVTAGWQEREGEDEELHEHLGGHTLNLRIWERVEQVFQEDPELFEAVRGRHDVLRKLQGVYRLRLSPALSAARELMSSDAEPWLVEPEVQAAIEAVRALDAHHLQRVREVHEEFESRWRLDERDALRRKRDELARELKTVEALAIAGGHVAVLLNRMRLLDLVAAAGERPLFAWGAGAMALSERVVLFHDSPPQGPGDAEVLEAGLALVPDVVPLPHARQRLRLEDVDRVALFARRFGPAACTVLESGSRVDCDDGRPRVAPGTQRLDPAGTVVEAGAS